MTKRDDTELSGEQRLRQRKSAFWRFTTLAFIVAVIAGMASGFLTGLAEEGALPVSVPLLAWVAIIGGMAWFTRDYFRRVDELDLQDNLWAHLYGIYAFGAIWSTWYIMADLDLASYPTSGASVLLLMVSVFSVYALRKLGWR